MEETARSIHGILTSTPIQLSASPKVFLAGGLGTDAMSTDGANLLSSATVSRTRRINWICERSAAT